MNLGEKLNRIRRQLAVGVVGVGVVTLMASCHGYWLDSGAKIYWVDSNDCADDSSRIVLASPGGRVGGNTGYFYSDANGCHPADAHYYGLEEANVLYRGASGSCWIGPTVDSGPFFAHYISHEDQLPYTCGTGDYVNISYHAMHSLITGWHHNFRWSPGDRL